MFSHEGPARTARSNSILAGYLAFVAGFTNTAGLTLIGAFTSHVTGSVGRVSSSLAQGQPAAAAGAAVLVALFLGGAVVASLLVESNLFRRTSSAYGAALLVQGSLLAVFIFTGAGGLLSFSMGMQNSLVTRLSGSVVRTTHLTGVVTDLGIEIARWLRWRATRLGAGAAGRNPPARPAPVRSLLLLTVALAFTLGGLAGALAAPSWGTWSIAVPSAAILAAAIYAVASGPRQPAA